MSFTFYYFIPFLSSQHPYYSPFFILLIISSWIEAVWQEVPLLTYHHQVFSPTCVCTHVTLFYSCQNGNSILVPVKGKTLYLCFISCPHLPQVLWYCDYPNTILALSCPSLPNPSCLWRHDSVSSILKHKQNPPWSPYSPPATDLLFVPWPHLEPLESVALTCFVSSHSLFIPLKFNFVTILPVKLLLSKSLLPFTNWKY